MVTIDVGNTDADSGSSDSGKTRLRSIYACNDTVDVALFTDPEEIYLMKVCILQFFHTIYHSFITKIYF